MKLKSKIINVNDTHITLSIPCNIIYRNKHECSESKFFTKELIELKLPYLKKDKCNFINDKYFYHLLEYSFKRLLINTVLVKRIKELEKHVNINNIGGFYDLRKYSIIQNLSNKYCNDVISNLTIFNLDLKDLIVINPNFVVNEKYDFRFNQVKCVTYNKEYYFIPSTVECYIYTTRIITALIRKNKIRQILD